MKFPLLTIQIRSERDVVLCRQRARQIARMLGFDEQDQVRIATTISELTRNVYQYAKRGKLDFSCDTYNRSLITVISDQGPGIPHLNSILRGDYVSETGLGVGLAGARRLMDNFEIETKPGNGTTITIGKKAPAPGIITRKELEILKNNIANQANEDPFQEIQHQNQELLATMEELEKRQQELNQLNRELEDTNRGVVALYAELDEKADFLRRAYEIKTRFLSNMTHEFRTPLNSILGLSRILLDRLDGSLNTEQEKQVSFIRRAATDLSELVNDLLDLSKVEAGKITIRPTEFSISDLFGALRGMLRPLLTHNSSINLIFDEPRDVPVMFTDESKVSQILRNFISNAIKYTERGEIRVTASAKTINDPGADREAKLVTISVADTGIGIAEEDIGRIFDEFTQVDGPHQKRIKGTGLGLSLAKKLAEVLGGEVTVESKPGQGSRFSVTLPATYDSQSETSQIINIIKNADTNLLPVLLVDDNAEALFIYESYLKGTRFQPIPAHSVKEAREALRAIRPAAIILDIVLQHENGWSLLAELKREDSTRDIPVIVISMVESEDLAMKRGATAFHCKPVEKSWLLNVLTSNVASSTSIKVLLIDDDDVSRYLFRSLLSNSGYYLLEATGGRDGVRIATRENPDVIFLDLDMADLGGAEVIKLLAQEPRTQGIPIVIYTANTTPQSIRSNVNCIGILSKDLSNREHSRARLHDLVSKAQHSVNKN
ncbi:MAG: ATP-binding protein [Candidatus Methylacidiphilales bacterium]|nr:ATP-binding protein [Candidatus Methylacidiphilales bacterium]